jgi:acyl-CoA thioester hydrolase
LERITQFRTRPRYAETDQMGMVYYATHLVWFECARNEWLRSFGISYAEVERRGLFLPVRRCEVTYHRAARYDQPIAVETRVTALTAARIQFAYRIVNESDGALLAEGMTLHPFTDTGGKVTRRGFEALGIIP